MSSCPLVDSSGLPLVHWTSMFTDTCIYGDFQAVAWASQYFSIAVWVYAGTYQSYKLYTTKDTNGFSESFLLCWILGAVLNTIGCWFTMQMPFQIFLALYFLVSDSFLYFQFKYYAARPWLKLELDIKEECEVLIAKDPNAAEFLEAATHERASSISKMPISQSTSLLSSSSSSSESSSYSPSQGYSTFTPAVVLGVVYNASTGSCAPLPPLPSPSSSSSAESVAEFVTKVVTSETSQGLALLTVLRLAVGTTAAWASNILYTVSRIPQIRLNYRRKSCEGVSPALFVATLFANFSYCLTIAGEWKSISDPQAASNFLLKELPFIWGAVSTTVADIFIFAQFYIYRNNDGVDYEKLAANCEEMFSSNDDNF